MLHTRMSLVCVTLGALLLPSPDARADVACQIYGFAAYEADGTIATMSMEGRWQRWAPDAQDPTSEVFSNVWLTCLWYVSHVGEVAPDGSYLTVMTDSGLLEITPEGNRAFPDIGPYFGEWRMIYLADGRAVMLTQGQTPNGGAESRLFVESAPSSRDFSLSHPLDIRCQNSSQIHTITQVADERVAIACSQGLIVMDTQTGELVNSDVLGPLAGHQNLVIDVWSNGTGAVLYVLSMEQEPPPDGEPVFQLTQVAMDVDGTMTFETIRDDLIGWRRFGELAAIDDRSVALRGNDGLEFMQRDPNGAWTSQVVAPEFDGNRIEAMTGPTRILVSGWNVTEYTLGADSAWASRSLTPVGNPPFRYDNDGCSASRTHPSGFFWLVLLALAMPLRRRLRHSA